MPSLLIAVPSYDRADSIAGRCLSWLAAVPPCWHGLNIYWVVCVEPQQYDAYERVVPSMHLISSWRDAFINGQLAAIQQYALLHDFDYVWKVDDDMVPVVTDAVARELYQVTHDSMPVLAAAVVDAAEAIVDAFRAPSVGAVGFLTRAEYEDQTTPRLFPFMNKIADASYVVRAKDLTLPDACKVWDDFFISLRARVDGLSTMHYGKMALDGIYLTNEGGLQSRDRREVENETLAYMQENHYRDLSFVEDRTGRRFPTHCLLNALS